MALSTDDIATQIGSTVDGSRTAIRGLVKKGYLVQDYGNAYAFYKLPQYEKAMEQNQYEDKNGTKAPETSMLTNGKNSG